MSSSAGGQPESSPPRAQFAAEVLTELAQVREYLERAEGLTDPQRSLVNELAFDVLKRRRGLSSTQRWSSPKSLHDLWCELAELVGALDAEAVEIASVLTRDGVSGSCSELLSTAVKLSS